MSEKFKLQKQTNSQNKQNVDFFKRFEDLLVIYINVLGNY